MIQLMDEEVVQKFDKREGTADQFYSDPAIKTLDSPPAMRYT